MRPQTQLLNDFRTQHHMTIPDINSAVRELGKLFGPAPYTISKRSFPGAKKVYADLCNLNGESCEVCSRKPPVVNLLIASRTKPITKEAEIKDLRLLCDKDAREYRKTKSRE